MFLGGAVWLHTVWIETRSLRVNSGDGGRGKGAGSLLGRDGAKKIHPGSPGLMLVGREMLQRGGGEDWDLGLGFFCPYCRSSVRNQLFTPCLL